MLIRRNLSSLKKPSQIGRTCEGGKRGETAGAACYAAEEALAVTARRLRAESQRVMSISFGHA